MKPEITDTIGRLRASRSFPWLRALDAADLGSPAPDEPHPDVVLRPYLWLIGRVGDGVPLTKAGYLPPALVTETMVELGWADDWFGAMTREDSTLPVLTLRETAQRFGLVRKNRGRLLTTATGCRLADDPLGLWWHLADRLPLGAAEPQQDAGVLYLVTVAAGMPLDDGLLARGMSALGWIVPGMPGLLGHSRPSLRRARRGRLRPARPRSVPRPLGRDCADARGATVGSGGSSRTRLSAGAAGCPS